MEQMRTKRKKNINRFVRNAFLTMRNGGAESDCEKMLQETSKKE